jgi:hypothetical protein
LARVPVPKASINTQKNSSPRDIFDLHLLDSLYTPVYKDATKAKEGIGSHRGKNDFWAFTQRIDGVRLVQARHLQIDSSLLSYSSR